MEHIRDVMEKLLLSWEHQINFEQANEVKCTVCSSQAIHIVLIAVNQNGNVVITKNNNLETYQCPPDTQRGAIVVLRFFCEQGHLFDLKWQFHKGIVYTQKNTIDSNCAIMPITLWRN